MAKCKRCNVSIRDDTQVCPLCRCVVEQDGPGENTYPDVHITVRRLKRISNVCLFVLLMASASLLLVNYTWSPGWWWSLIPVAAMAYGYLLLRFAILSEHGYRTKLVVLVLLGVALVVLIDVLTGFHRWSVNCVLPSGLMLVDCIVVVMMLVNRRNWQSYLVLQIGMILLSLVPLLLWWLDVVTWPMLSVIGFGVALFLFLGSLIIGDQRARVELSRRFHI